jgi:flagellar hook-length control protein FliK
MMKLVQTNSLEKSNSGTLQKTRMHNNEFHEVALHAQLFHAEERFNKNTSRIKDSNENNILSDDADNVDTEDGSLSEDVLIKPIDELKLAEGYRIFGRLFSQIESHMAGEIQTPIAAPDLATNAPPKLARQTSVVTPVEFPKEKSVVIDFAKVAARSGRGAKNDKASIDSDHLRNLATNAAREARQETLAFAKQNDEVEAISASEVAAEQPNLKLMEDFVEFGIIGVNAPLTEPKGVSNFLSATNSSQRIDHIVRAVVEESQKLSDPRIVSNTLAVQGNGNSQALRLSLHPAELGSVDITISKRGRRLEVTISPQMESTSAILRGDVQQLLTSLGIACADTDKVLVRIKSADGFIAAQEGNTATQSSASDGDSPKSDRQHSNHTQSGEVKSQFESLPNERRKIEIIEPIDRVLEPGAMYI